MIPFEEIPTNFVSSTLTVLQKEIIQIKYYIKVQLDKWKGTRYELYEELIPKLRLSIHRIRKLTQGLPRELHTEDIVCAACKDEFKLKPQAYWSYFDDDENILLLCSRKCSESAPAGVKDLSERRFYYIKDEAKNIQGTQ